MIVVAEAELDVLWGRCDGWPCLAGLDVVVVPAEPLLGPPTVRVAENGVDKGLSEVAPCGGAEVVGCVDVIVATLLGLSRGRSRMTALGKVSRWKGVSLRTASNSRDKDKGHSVH